MSPIKLAAKAIHQFAEKPINDTVGGFIQKVTLVLMPVLLTAGFALGGWLGSSLWREVRSNTTGIQEVGVRITAIEANRYTQADAKVDRDITFGQWTSHLADIAKQREADLSQYGEIKSDIKLLIQKVDQLSKQ